MTMDVMSSDKSEDGNIAVKDLMWRSDVVNGFFPKLDEEATKKRLIKQNDKPKLG